MKSDVNGELEQKVGADRVLEPLGALPQPAERLDPSGPVRPFEIEVSVERLYLDSTSHRQIRERCGGEPDAMAERILEIVAARGKMHNPETDSGGVLLGTVAAAGERLDSAPPAGARIVTLASLTLTPLRLELITGLDPASPQIEASGTAYVCERAPWGPVPDDLPLRTVLEVYDVYTAASHVRALAPHSGTVCVLGAGHGGKLAMAAAREAMEDGTVVAVDVDPHAVELVSRLGLCDIGVTADLRYPLGAVEALRHAGAPLADLTVLVASAPGCEPTAIMQTAAGGTVLFLSMATRFSTAALAGDGLSSDARMVVGTGYTPDLGSYALDLVRRAPALREALGAPVEEAA
jgi:L-erythro-3,5-diaminohexanoate dehydrogenase